MIARITIKKTFDETKVFSKEYKRGDFEEFFIDEGKYLDKLSDIMKERATDGDSFTVTYTVEVIA